MSRLIDVVKALDAVRRCCSGAMPQSKVIGLLEGIVHQFRAPMEARAVAIPAGRIAAWLLTLAARPMTPPPLIPHGVPTRISPTELPIPKIPVVPDVLKELGIGRVDISGHIAQEAARALEEARRFDPCSLLLGCVAEEFRKLVLAQGQSSRKDRIRYIDYDWVAHYFRTSPKHVPKGRQRYVRQQK